MKNGKNSKWENKNKMKKVIINNKKSEEKWKTSKSQKRQKKVNI